MKRHALLLARLAVGLALLVYQLSCSALRALGERIRATDVLLDLVGPGLIALLSLSGAVDWTSRRALEAA